MARSGHDDPLFNRHRTGKNARQGRFEEGRRQAACRSQDRSHSRRDRHRSSDDAAQADPAARAIHDHQRVSADHARDRADSALRSDPRSSPDGSQDQNTPDQRPRTGARRQKIVFGAGAPRRSRDGRCDAVFRPLGTGRAYRIVPRSRDARGDRVLFQHAAVAVGADCHRGRSDAGDRDIRRSPHLAG